MGQVTEAQIREMFSSIIGGATQGNFLLGRAEKSSIFPQAAYSQGKGEEKGAQLSKLNLHSTLVSIWSAKGRGWLGMLG